MSTETREIDLAVEGMTCSSCVARVEKKLNRVPGVQATVNLALESAHVRVAPAAIGLAQHQQPGEDRQQDRPVQRLPREIQAENREVQGDQRQPER